MPSEAQARLTINRLLQEAGWRLLSDGAGRPANVVCEHRVRRHPLAPNADLGNDFQKAPGGFVDDLKGVNQEELRAGDPRALERRLLLDAYTTFGCGDAGLSRAVAALAPEERALVLAHIAALVPLADYDQAAA